MWRLSRLMTSVTVLAVLASGCGSSGNAGGDDALVLQFIQWDNTGLTQADSVGQSSADVDVIQDLCPGTPPTPEPFTQTVINAIFQNNEGADIQLQGYRTEIAEPLLAQTNITNGVLTAAITGGRCAASQRQCFSDNDCGGGFGTCQHTPTTVSGIVLFDFIAKAVVATVSQSHPGVLGQAIPLKVTFFGADPTRSFQIAANYLVTFADFDNCMASTTSGAGAP